jgi:hypothetical protein
MKYIQWVKSLFSKKEVLKPPPKFKIGDEVRITIYNSYSEFWYKGHVIDISNSLHTNDPISVPHQFMYKVHFLNGTGNGLTYWYLESELRKYSLEEERDSRIDEVLKDILL